MKDAPSADTEAGVLRRIRWTLAVFIFGLVMSGLTAFPLLYETGLLVKILGGHPAPAIAGLAAWVNRVHEGLQNTDTAYPFIAYGTDWLAFGHLVIALFFVGPLRDPVRNVFILKAGLWACVAVWPLALICGPIRGIPLCWRLVDCTFGVLGLPLLGYCLRLTRQLPGWPCATTPKDGR